MQLKATAIISLIYIAFPRCLEAACPIPCRNGGSCDISECSCPPNTYGSACEYSTSYILNYINASAPNLVGYWPLNSFYLANDIGPNAIPTTMNLSASYISGPYGRNLSAVNLPTTARIVISSPLIDFDATVNTSFSFGMWITGTTTASYFFPLTFFTGTTAGCYFYQNTAGTLYYYPSTSAINCACTLATNWVYTGVVYDASTKKAQIFYNSNFTISTPVLTNSPVTHSNAVINYYPPSVSYVGTVKIACFSMHRAALTLNQMLAVKDSCKLFSAICSPNCANGGFCVGSNMCECINGWTGPTCQQCSVSNTCPCDTGYTGPSCETPICTSPCINGNCTSPDYCTCWLGASGPTCDTMNCPCVNGGSCLASSTHCLCPPSTYGNLCEYSTSLIQNYIDNISPNLTAYWPFTGYYAIEDIGPNSIYTNASVTTPISYLPGPYGLSQASVFLPVNNWLEMNSNLFDFDVNGSSWTWGMWMTANSTNTFYFLSHYSGTSMTAYHYSNTAGTVYFYSSSSTSLACATKPDWQYIAYVYEASNKTLRIFCNSSFSTSTLTLTTHPSMTSKVRVNYYTSTTYMANMRMACLSVHRAALNLNQVIALKDSCRLFEISCASNCTNGGTCIGFNLCQCQPGYTGTYCENIFCQQGCHNGATCVGPNTCACMPGYTGSSCESGICSQTCINGNCTAPDVCTCWLGASGPSCDTMNCPCYNGGSCFASSTYCICQPGTYGDLCEYSTTYMQNYIDNIAVNLTAYWPFTGYYTIQDIGPNSIYTNASITTPISYLPGPYGLSQASVFLPVNNWVEMNSDLFDFDVNGSSWTWGMWMTANSTSTFYFLSHYSGTSMTAYHYSNTGGTVYFYSSSGGSFGVCATKPDWQYIAYVYEASNKTVRVFCNSTFSTSTLTLTTHPAITSKVRVNYYTSTTYMANMRLACLSVHRAALNLTQVIALKESCRLFEISCSSNCTNGGTCIGFNLCQCQPGYTGTFCENINCEQGCYNGATCASPNTCACMPGYTGSSCQNAICSQACVNGNCTAPDVCTCAFSFSGPTCNASDCPCLNGGSCTLTGCSCPSDNSGTLCEYSKPLIMSFINAISPNLVAYWPFTASYQADDIGPNLIHSRPNATMSHLPGPYGLPQSSIFIPLNSWIEINSNLFDFDVNGSSWTWGFWVTANATSTFYFLTHWAGTTMRARHYSSYSGSVYFNSPSYTYNFGSCSSLGGWQYIAYVYDSTTMAVKVYCNSSFLGGTWNYGIPSTESKVMVNYYSSTSYSSNMRMACLSVHREALNVTQVTALRDSCKYFEISCSPNCSNGGTCIGFNICLCQPGYTGTFCDDIICEEDCANGATCTGPNTCTCLPGYTGDRCQLGICTETCLHGNCTGPDQCTCSFGYTGTSCNVSNCPCLNGASCMPSGCSCSPGIYGSLCEYSTSVQLPYINNAAPNLLGYWPLTNEYLGTDIGPNSMTAELNSTAPFAVGPYGRNLSAFFAPSNSYLSITSSLIDFKLTNSSWTWGTWLNAGTLSGSAYFFMFTYGNGSTATLYHRYTSSVMYYYFGTSGSSVTLCFPYNSWVYFALVYDSTTRTMKYFCNSTFSASSTTTSIQPITQQKLWMNHFPPTPSYTTNLRLSCLSVHKAALSLTQMLAVRDSCKLFTISCSQNCSNGGSCIGLDLCQCSAGWTGVTCQSPICIPPCVNGNCSAANTCTCSAGYNGTTCSTPICASACQNNGTCIAPNICSCSSGWTGANCTTPTCNPTCSNGGSCVAPNTCACPSDWTGTSCNAAICNPQCQNGNCTAPNVCTCSLGWTGSTCNNSNCNPACLNGGTCFGSTCSCSPGFRGTYCQFSAVFIESQLNNSNSNLIAYWPLNPDFDSQDAYLYRVNGTFSGTLNATVGPYGKSSSAIMTTFSSYRYVTFSSSLLEIGASSSSWTFATWIKTGTTIPAPLWHFYSPTSNSTEGFCIYQTSVVNSLYVSTPASTSSWSCTMSGTWTHIAFTFTNSTKVLRAYCNGGTLIGSLTLTTNPVTYSRVYMGYRPYSPSSHSTQYACASIHSTDLSASKISEVRDLCRYFKIDCATACGNGGTCIGSDTCLCPAGYTGTYCQNPICTLPCVQGNCSAPDTCTCSTGWSGPQCNAAICSSPCQNGGNCTAPDTCTCVSGWNGVSCSDPICTSPCLNSGSCTAPNTCTCPALTWSGSVCQNPVCLPTCLHGNCSSPGNCTCEDGWIGSACNYAVCGSIGCANDGNCTAPDNCVCQQGWSGAQCDVAICNQPCVNGGSCTAPDTCTCEPGWTGSLCETAICSSACLNGASCSAPDTCSCVTGFTGTLCEWGVCSPPCSQGNCTGPNVCTCNAGWTGAVCDSAICSSPCDNGGSCTGPDTCSCDTGYTGATCDTAICSPSCSAYGNCTSPNVCSCQSGWNGAVCNYPICSHSCQNGGYCSAPETCVCPTGWTGMQCETPICSLACSPSGGECTAPEVCSCYSGWKGLQCTTPDCTLPCLNGGNCTGPDECTCPRAWEGEQCNIQSCIPDCINGNCSNGVCLCEDRWTGQACELGICDVPCKNNGTCSSPNVCTCLIGFKGTYCENSTASFTTEDLSAMTDAQLIQNIGPVTNVVKNMAASLTVSPAAEKVTEMLGTLGSMLDRFGNVSDLSPEKFADIASTASSAADAMLTAVTADAKSDDDDEPKYEEQTMKCKLEADGKLSAVEPSKPPPAADAKEKMRKMFNSFMSMLVNMFSNLRAVLKPGMNMTFSGEFYGATVFNVRLRDVPGLVLDSKLATATFPKIDNVFDLFGPMPAKCSPMTADSTIPVILSAFIVNVMDVDKPFNMPTVAVRMYCPEQAELVLNRAYPTKIAAKPSQKKAALFNNQKKDAQCDISKVKCDLSENAEAIGSMATFPLTLNAGDFVLIFPNIEFDYSIYISFNSTPSVSRYDLQLNVTNQNVSIVQNGTFDAPRWHHRHEESGDLRIIISEKAIDHFLNPTEQAEHAKLSIYVFTKKNFSNFASLEDLPSSACDLQRTYGYHLRIGLAKEDNSTKKVKRSIDAATADGFQLEPESTESAVVFKSSYFGDFGADLAVSPNTIEFSDIFANFATLVANNAGVLAFQCAAIALFLVGVGICWKFDKEDLKEWSFLPILSNRKHQTVRYLISVQLTKVKNFNMTPRVSIRLIGNVYDTTWRVLEDGVRSKVFDGKHPANFTLTTQVTVGRIDAIELALDQQNQSLNPKKNLQMYVDRVVIVDAERGLKYVYLVKSNMTKGDTVKTSLATEDEMKGYTYLISGHSRASITDIHPWLSTMKRPLPSNWTRVERLACVVSALFMAMLVNAMFYGKEATAPKVGLKIGGFFTLSWFTLWTSFIGCVIVIPPTAVIAFIFKKIKRKSAEKSAYATVFNVKVNEAATESKTMFIEDEKEFKKKKPLELPYWTIIIAWLLVASCIGTSAFLVVMYSLSWGQEKSLAWLSGMFLNVIQDIILIQPVKVVLTSIFSATLHSLPDDGMNLGKLTYNPNNNRRKVELFNRLRGVLTGIFHHALYVMIFAVVIATMTNPYAYLQINSLRPNVAIHGIDTFKGTVKDYEQIFEWLNDTALSMVLNGNQLDKGGIFYSANALYRVPNPHVSLLGPIRLTQQRVSVSPCSLERSVVPKFVQRYTLPLTTRFDYNDSQIQCQNGFSNSLGKADASENKSFNGSWYNLAEPQNFWEAVNLTYFDEPWIYRETDGISYSGLEATYKTGGYYVDLPKKISNARTVIAYLRHSKWLDNATNSLFVEFNLFNVQTNLFIPVKVVFEALSAGGMSYHIRMFPLQLYMYSGASSMLNFIIQGLWVIVLLTHLIRVCRSLKKEGRKAFFANGWNILDVAQISLGIGIVAFFAARVYVIIGFINRIQTMRTTFISLDLLANWEDLLFCLFGIEFFLAMFCFFRHLSVNKHWAVFMGTLSNGKLELATYGSVFSLATILFAGIAFLIMGNDFWNFSTYSRSILCLIGSIMGTINFNEINSTFYLFLTMVYTSIVVFLGTNVFVTLIMAAYGEVTVDVERKTSWDSELSEYMAQAVKEIVFRSKPVQTSTTKNSEDFKPVGEKNFAKLEMVVQRFCQFTDGQLDSFTSAEASKTERSQLLWLSDLKENIEKHERNVRRPSRPVSMHQLSTDVANGSRIDRRVASTHSNPSVSCESVQVNLKDRDVAVKEVTKTNAGTSYRRTKWGTMNLYIPGAGRKLYPVNH